MQKTKKFLISTTISFVVFSILILPAVSAAAGLVPCDNSAGNPCNFNQLMNLVNIVIHFVLFYMVIPIVAIMFAYAGFEMITAGGESAHARTKAKKIFFTAVVGLIIAMAAWLIVRTVLSILGYNGAWIGFPLSQGFTP